MILLSGRLNHNAEFQQNWPITFALILLTDTTASDFVGKDKKITKYK